MRGYCIAGLGFGDEGKGLATDALCRQHEVSLVVKYTGGPQCSHTVCLPDGRFHRFAQFGSGTFLPNCRTHIGPEVLVEPFAMVNEANALSKLKVDNPFDRMTIDPNCVIITPWHWMANQIRELSRSTDRHGSCGMGIGETKSMIECDKLYILVRDVQQTGLRELLVGIRAAALRSLPIIPNKQLFTDMIEENIDNLVDFYQAWSKKIVVKTEPLLSGDVIFEGAQGVLLDEKHGFAPYNTWSNTTFDHALTLCHKWKLNPTKLGVLRTYMTRHGAGPFVSEDASYNWPDHNTEDKWQGNFRQGTFDMVMARHAINACDGVDEIILTHLDRAKDWQYCSNYNCYHPHYDTNNLNYCKAVIAYGDPISTIEEELEIPVKYTSFGPTAEQFCTTNLLNYCTGIEEKTK